MMTEGASALPSRAVQEERGLVGVVIVDDDPLVRAGLRMILGADKRLTILGEAADGQAGVEMVVATGPEVVLMDIRMPRMDGLAATRHLAELGNAARIIVLTTFDADDMVASALRAGASGFLLKDTDPAELVRAVRVVARGEPMLSPSVTAQLMATVARDEGSQRSATAIASLGGLTEREHEVAVALGRGLSNAEIAADLYMSVATVKAHVGRILAKLGMQNRTQIAICVHDAGLA